MDRVMLFNALQLLATAYAMLRGGAPERITGFALLAAAVATRLLVSDLAVRFVAVEGGVLVVDLLLLAALLIVAMRADRYWTLWLAALQALGTGAHLVRYVDHDVLRFVYALLTAFWSYPIIVLLIAGTHRHQGRLARDGFDLDWSQRGHSAV